MEKMTFMQLREARNKANEKLGDLYMNAKNRELTAEEKIEEMNLTRELNQLDEQMKFLNRESDNAKAQAEARKANKAKAFRELLRTCATAGPTAKFCCVPPALATPTPSRHRVPSISASMR